MKEKISIIFVCVGNACRSQMSEGWARALGGDRVTVFSAGSRPAGFVAAEAVDVMKEKGMDISSHHSKGLEEFVDRTFDYVVTMGCGDHCPTLRARHRLVWKIPDPYGLPSDGFREVRDDLEQRIRDLLDSL